MNEWCHYIASSDVTLCYIKILFEKKKAVGVQFRDGEEVRTVKAKKEVLLAAGTVGSAKILLLSGVGPRNHLQANKVGRGLL